MKRLNIPERYPGERLIESRVGVAVIFAGAMVFLLAIAAVEVLRRAALWIAPLAPVAA